MIQLWTWSGISRVRSLSISEWWGKVSNALEKSIEITATNSIVINKLVTCWSSTMIAAVRNPEGRKDNCYFSISGNGGLCKTGWSCDCTITRSTSLDNTGTTEIGLYSAGEISLGTLGIGLMTAVFHWSETCASVTDTFIKCASVELMTGTRRLSKQAVPQLWAWDDRAYKRPRRTLE